MKNLLLRVGAIALAFLAVPAAGQGVVQLPQVKNAGGANVPAAASVSIDSSGVEKGTVSNPVVTGSMTLAATSTGQRGTATSSAVTPTSGTASFSGGVATIGPLTPQLGRPVHVRLFGTWTGSAYVATSGDNCVTLTPLTVGGAAWGAYTANANEDVDLPFRSGISECLVATVTSGTLTYSLDQ